MKLLKLFRDPRCKQKDLWSKVSKNMRQNGVDVTANMCDRKWRNLKQAFKSNYYKTLKCPSTVIKWVFYDDMLKILDPKKYKPGQRKSCTIPLLSASKNNQALPKTIVLSSKLGENHFVFPFEQNVNQQTENNVNSSSPLINNMNIVKSEKQDDSYQQVLICDDGYFVNDDSIVYQVEGSEAVNCVVDPISGQLADNSTSQTEEIPVWFQNFIEQYRNDEDNKLAAMKKMHSELMEIKIKNPYVKKSPDQNLYGDWKSGEEVDERGSLEKTEKKMDAVRKASRRGVTGGPQMKKKCI
uniref:Myb/SANT-like DNA-binding domain-containing protein n=1 Tax=Timema bartmani TaxID=61472 RepID=A0A7R9EQM2_9NEOP|nr:unnamed protein product [Timema bartmani]